MNLDTDALRERFAEVWRQFTAGQKAMLAIGAVAIVLSVYTFMQWASAPSYQPLYSGLEAEDAAEITAELDTMGVPYRLEDAGRTIEVKREDVHETRIALSAEGLPALGSPGYELLDDQSITTSEFKQRIDLQRAMEGELAETIASLDAISDATVHLVIPEDDLFSGDDIKATASVLVTPRGMTTLTAGQVQAVVHLVASSVEGLTPESITVADSSGRVLSAPGEAGTELASGDARLSQKIAFEAALARSIENDLLAPITGFGKARVVVSADLDFDSRESFSESFGEPGTAPEIQTDTSSESYTGNGTIIGGVLGPEIDGGGDATEESTTEYERADASTTFGVDKVTEQVVSAPGSVRRLSIAVVVDEATGVDTAVVQNLVAAGAGIIEARGDTIQVSAVAFSADDVPPAVEGTSSGGSDDLIPTAIRTAGTLLIVLAVLLLAYRSAKKSSLAKYPLAVPLPGDVDGLLALGAGSDEDDDVDEESEEAEIPQMALIGSGEASPQLVLQNQIGELIDQQPEDVASVLRTWLADRRS